MRLIDADALKPDHYEEYEAKDDEYVYRYYSEEQIDNAPSIDIVRCKECRLSEVYQFDSLDTNRRFCRAFTTKIVNDDDFCSYGERREP